MDEEVGVVQLEEIKNENENETREKEIENNKEEKVSDDKKEEIQPSFGKKAFEFLKAKHPWVVLTIALFSVSSAATALKMIPVQALMKASWRLQATSLLLLMGFIYDFKTANPETRQRWKTPRALATMLASGFCLAVHFGTWIWSLEITSLDHSLLFVTAHPLVIITGHFVLRALKIVKTMPSVGETIGSILGFVGLAITVGDSTHPGSKATVQGDFLAFLGAVAVIGYLLAGRNLRGWMPLFMYAFPVTLSSAIFLAIAAYASPGVPLKLVLFGWFELKYLPFIIYIALFPGGFGHTGLNYVIKFISPIVVSVTLLLEPVIGTFIGYMLGVGDVPGMWTFIGAPVCIAGLVLVTVATYRREKKEKETINEK